MSPTIPSLSDPSVETRPVCTDLSVVIPVYRSESTLVRLVDRLLPVLEATGRRHEIIFVEDGSPDDSWAVLGRLQAAHPDRIAAIQLMRNYGQHNALMCGLRHARGRLVVTMDDDLQNPPEEIPKLLEAIEARNLDLVYGDYASRKKHDGWRNLGSSLVNAFYRITFRQSDHRHFLPDHPERACREHLLLTT